MAASGLNAADVTQNLIYRTVFMFAHVLLELITEVNIRVRIFCVNMCCSGMGI